MTARPRWTFAARTPTEWRMLGDDHLLRYNLTNIRRAGLFAGIALAGCGDTVTIVEPAPVYADVADELQARVNDINRTLVRCWQITSCRGQHLITWTSWDSTHAPAFLIRRKP